MSAALSNKTEMQLRIQAAATAAGMNLEELGDRCGEIAPDIRGLSGSTMRKVGGTLPASVDKLEVIARATGAPVAFLRGGWTGLAAESRERAEAAVSAVMAARAASPPSGDSPPQQSGIHQGRTRKAG